MFADDLMKIVMQRLQVRLQTQNGKDIVVTLVDTKTGYGVLCGGTRLQMDFKVELKNGDVHGGMPFVIHDQQ
jgi:hypothetical protein